MRASWDATAALGPARAEFGDHGYEDASVVRIIERSGTTRATFYKHYESKRRLFFAAVLAALADLSGTLPASDPSAPFWSEVEALLTAGHRWGLSHPADVRLIHDGVRLAAEELDEPGARLVTAAVRGQVAAWVDHGRSAGEVRVDLDRDLAVDLAIAVVQTLDRRTLDEGGDGASAEALGGRSADLLRRMLSR